MDAFRELVLDSLRRRFASVKELGDKALAQIEEGDLAWAPNEASTSIAVIVQHLHGNMRSRWTDFLDSDGEKPWRDRDGEFEAGDASRERILGLWDAGWECTLRALQDLAPEDLDRVVTIRGQELSALDAIHRQLSHYGYHVGQIVWIARARRGEAWETLSIAKGTSREYRPTKRD